LLPSGTLPGVVLGVCVRVFAVSRPRVFRLVAVVVLPPGLWLVARALRTGTGDLLLSLTTVIGLGFVVVGRAGRGISMAGVAPVALACTFVAPMAGVVAYVLLGLVTPGKTDTHWTPDLLMATAGDDFEKGAETACTTLSRSPAQPPLHCTERNR
jgi:hypothetical protein